MKKPSDYQHFLDSLQQKFTDDMQRKMQLQSQLQSPPFPGPNGNLSRFNLGDRVRFTGVKKPEKFYNVGFWPIGTEGTIELFRGTGQYEKAATRDSGSTGSVLIWVNVTGSAEVPKGREKCWWDEDCFELVSTLPQQEADNKQKMKFKKGDKVKFVNKAFFQGSVSHYKTEGQIANNLCKHGSTILGDDYAKNFAEVVCYSKGFVVVTWKSDVGSVMQLGFDENDLALVKSKSDVNKVDLKKLDSLVIDIKVKEEIVSVLKQHQHKDKLLKKWGLGDILEYGFGMTFMFYGPPGTGKTWAANCIAKALGTTLLTISPSQIQSSEPGGANRAIEEAFATTKKSGQVLFIDECDSLIANRSDLGMILASEVNTLLTQIEKCEGVVILATNRIEHMDEALERRISLICEFPAPNLEQRREIWSRLVPKKLPLDVSVNFDKLSEETLTGGQIKNAILAAARLALAQEAKKVTHDHFTSSIERIRASKGLMGSASRYDQRGGGYGMSVGVTKTKGFLRKALGESEEPK